MTPINRRSVLAAELRHLRSAPLSRLSAKPNRNSDSAARSPKPISRAEAYKAFAAAIKDDFDFEPYWGNTLFKQGAELVALAARQSRPLQFGAGRYLQADSGLVAADVGLSVPRLPTT